jgi:DNA primase
VEAPTASEVATTFYTCVWGLHEPSVIGPMVGWFFATPFKPPLHRRLGHFPIFNCWGTKGAGKTSLLQLFWRLFGVVSPLFSVTETDFSLLTLLSATTSIPLVFDEFKPWDMRQDQVRRFERMVRRVYQGEVEHRGRPDLTPDGRWFVARTSRTRSRSPSACPGT